MLDITVGLSELANVSEIYIVALNNEVKELLWLLRPDFEGAPKITAIEIAGEALQPFTFEWGQEGRPTFSEPLSFLYEPNAAIMKSGAFHLLSEAYGVHKLHEHSHLYTGERPISFPGRSFTIDKVIPYSKKEMRTLNLSKANITTRNFPESVAQIRKKWRIKEGGEDYVFFTTIGDSKKVVLCCRKVTKN